jgi:chemotaxis protein MotB
MTSATNQRPIIIKKVKKVVGGGHHGGAWKVAYADFVTAMMAFFLLMWLINTTSPEQRRGIADFFAPASVSESTSGAGGLLAGEAMAENGARQRNTIPEDTREAPGDPDVPTQVEDPNQASPSASAFAEAQTRREDAEFMRAEMAIRQAMADMPEIAELSRNLIMDVTPEGLRIQIIDQEGRSMFAAGAIQPNERGRRLLTAVARAVAQLPNRMTIAGHTDSAPAPGRANNWEISVDRANAARAILQRNGVPQDQIFQVAGRADAEPLYPDDPEQPGNRRIAITLLREAPPLPEDLGL